MKSKYLTIIFSTALTFSSCNDFFEIERPQETQWTTTSTYEQGLSASYVNIQWSEAGRGYSQYIDFLTSGTASLMQGNTPGLDGEKLFYRSFSEKLSRMTGVWKQSYKIVTMSNLALDVDRDGNGNPFNLNVNSDDYKHNRLRLLKTLASGCGRALSTPATSGRSISRLRAVTPAPALAGGYCFGSRAALPCTHLVKG